MRSVYTPPDIRDVTRTSGGFVLLLMVGACCAVAGLLAQETAAAAASPTSFLPEASAAVPRVLPPEPGQSVAVTETSPAIAGTLAVALVERMNAARVTAGLRPLQRDASLDAVAAARATDLLDEGYFAHFGPAGQSALTEMAARGIGYGLAGENLARNNYLDGDTLGVAFEGLMASTTHRANILEPRFASAGAAVVRSDEGMWVYVTVFKD